MGKASKIYINYGVSLVEKAAALMNADENDLRVLSALLLRADGEGCSEYGDLAELFAMDDFDVSASIKYWKGAGMISSSGKKNGRGAESETEKSYAHRDGAVSHFTSIEEYTNDELSSILKKHVSSAFVDEAQKVMGKIFNKNEVGKLVGLVDQLGFEEEAVLAILSYCVRLGKKSLSYAEKIAISFYDEDISTALDVHSQIDYLERRNNAIEKIRGLYGFGGRTLTTTEKRFFTAWTEDYGFDFDTVRFAYELTVDATHEPAPKYTNAILKKWYENGVKTLAEAEVFVAEDKRQRAGQNTAKRTVVPKKTVQSDQKGEEIEEWFEQRLRHTLGES